MKTKNMCSLFMFLVSFCGAQTYPTGTITLTFNDPSRTGGFGSGGGPGRQIQTEIYYPATASGSQAPVANGQFPVIVFGHGFVMSWDSYDNIYKELSQRGYIVALPRTEGGFSPNHSEFGKDLKWVAARMLNLNTTNTLTNLFVGKLNLKCALAGHSMGGGASFLAAENNSTITCLFNFAAAETNPKSSTAAKNVTVPTLILGGAGDCVTPPANHQNLMYDSCSANIKFKIILKTITHCDFSNGNNFNCNFGQNSSGCPSTLTIANAQKRYMNFLNPFLDRLLKNDCQAGNNFMDSLMLSNTIHTKKSQGTLTCSVSSLPNQHGKNQLPVQVFPNPCFGELNVRIHEPIRQFCIFSSQGKLLDCISMNGSAESFSLSVHHWPEGLYYIRIQDENGHFYSHCCSIQKE